MPRTLWWEDNTLKMIDQRILPLHYEVITYADYRTVAQAITDMVVRGAPAIGAAGGFGMALAALQSPARERASFLGDLTAAQTVLDAARPTAVNLSWATRRIVDYAHHLVLPHVDDLRSAIVAEAQRIADEDVGINRRMGAFGAEVIAPRPGATRVNILTHCNAGSLATVDYGTTLGVVRAAVAQGQDVHVWVDETRPRLQGARLTAWELMQDSIPMTLIADNAAGMLMRLGRVDVVLYGADRVAANGDVANKIGSYKLAVLAKENGIPCYAVVPTPTIDLTLAHGDLIPIEERDADEVTVVGAERIAPEGVAVYNPAFDVTPHRYLTGIITDEGVCHPPFSVSLRKAVEAAETRRGGGAGSC